MRRKESPAPVRGRASLAERYGLEGEPDLAGFDDTRRRLDAFIAGTGHLDLGERAPSVHTADADEHPLADEKARDMVRMLTSIPSVYAAINEGRFEDARRLVDETCGPHAGTVFRPDIMIRAGRLDEALSLCDDRMAYEPGEYLIYAKVLRELGRMQSGGPGRRASGICPGSVLGATAGPTTRRSRRFGARRRRNSGPPGTRMRPTSPGRAGCTAALGMTA